MNFIFPQNDHKCRTAGEGKSVSNKENEACDVQGKVLKIRKERRQAFAPYPTNVQHKKKYTIRNVQHNTLR